jgi:ABC-2 type transport system permease protein
MRVEHPLVLLGMVLLSSAVFSLGGLINAVYARKFDDISIIPTFILTPLTYLGGVFYTVDLLPEAFREASLFNPILYMVNAFRYGVHGVSDVSIGAAFLIVVAFLVVLYTFAYWLLHRGIGLRS